MANAKPLYLCGGLQSSGSTLVAWCFLQRPDLDGILDARNDLLPELPVVTTPALYCKITISSFRLHEMIDHYADEGWDVRPMLVVRDVRYIFNSLVSKHYGANGTTAEEPPLRMRLRRFKEDWTDLSGRCPIVRYESLVAQPEQTLRKACDELQLAWQPAMMEWPKDKSQIADAGHGSPTFRKSRGQSFGDTADASLAAVRVERIPPKDIEWMEREFAEFNRCFGYAEHIPGGATDCERAAPSWENTRRYRKSQGPMAKIAAAWANLRHSIPPAASRKNRSA
jgi:hypothetical protein